MRSLLHESAGCASMKLAREPQKFSWSCKLSWLSHPLQSLPKGRALSFVLPVTFWSFLGWNDWISASLVVPTPLVWLVDLNSSWCLPDAKRRLLNVCCTIGQQNKWLSLHSHDFPWGLGLRRLGLVWTKPWVSTPNPPGINVLEPEQVLKKLLLISWLVANEGFHWAEPSGGWRVITMETFVLCSATSSNSFPGEQTLLCGSSIWVLTLFVRQINGQLEARQVESLLEQSFTYIRPEPNWCCCPHMRGNHWEVMNSGWMNPLLLNSRAGKMPN